MENLVAILMAGGAGTRFWPVSTEQRPKQFLSLFGGRSLLQESMDRLAGLVPPERILVLTSRDFVPLVREQLPEVPAHQVIGEPLRRDTAAAVALAALVTRRLFGDCVMAVLTADQKIAPEERFREILRSAAAGAEESGALYTMGVVPRFPATGYGYLRRGAPVARPDGVPHYRLLEFREKPGLETAKAFLESGEYLWNSGMFLWRTEAILGEFERLLPDHVRLLQGALEQWGTEGWEPALQAAFEPLPRTSIDFGVMEKAGDVRMVAADFDWDDVGGWLAVEPFLEQDPAGNHFRGRLAAFEASRNTVFCEDPAESVALVGLEDVVVIRAGHRTLVAPRHRLEDVKKMVERLDADLR